MLMIVILALLILSIVKEKTSITSLFFVPFSLLLANLALVLFFHGEVNWLLFFGMFKVFLFPIAFVIVLIYFYIFNFFPYTAIKYVLYFVLLYSNLIVVIQLANITKTNVLLSPELFSLLLYIGLPISIIFHKIKNVKILKLIKLLLYLTCLIPLVPVLIFIAVTTNFLLIGLLSIITCTVSFLLLEVVIPKAISIKWIKEKRFKERENKMAKPVFIRKPIMTSLFFIVILFISLITVPSFLVRGGYYFQSMVSNSHYQEISYIWDGKEIDTEGILVSKEGDTYFISTNEQKLLIIQTKEIRLVSK
ncbi:hypothetical protein [Virgibacillus necropolis]|uniref:Uncharacterized protein n=1 Tax=Virgibacillus necropolis TaxID=163877 RepID=A0A221MF98_9BACI|nr:hypothetical protein [Virgibacillus necropolis]ASN06317.1 hypothetical protein CFK40_15460 [Virgibacillus necropolis]